MPTVGQQYDGAEEFMMLMSDAKNHASTDEEKAFVSTMTDKFETFGVDMPVSISQCETLERIALGLHPLTDLAW